MKLWILGIAFGVLALPATVARAQEPVEAASARSFDFWGTGSGSYFYHRLSGDCETIQHRHGRNAAWGMAMMPLLQIVADNPGEGQHGGYRLRFRCVDGTSCIQRGHLTNVTGRVSEHTIPFGTIERARSFAQQVEDLRAVCSAGR